MTDLRALYQEVILDHNKKPRNWGVLADHNCQAHGYNPLCGDDYTVYAVVDDGIVKDLSFEGKGCAISKAAASMMTVRIKGQSVDYAEELIAQFRHMMTGETVPEPNELKHLKVFEGVSQLPSRIKCAVLPWHALQAAIEDRDAVSTEGENDQWSDETDPSNREDLF